MDRMLDFKYGIQQDKKDLNHWYLLMLKIQKLQFYAIMLKVLIPDLKDLQSFENIKKWLSIVREEQGYDV